MRNKREDFLRRRAEYMRRRRASGKKSKEAKPYDRLELDGRRKILPEQHAEIRALYKTLKSQREVARMYGVSRRLIVFILFPERLLALQKKHREEQHWKTYYNKDARRLYMRKYRAKKRLLNYN
jgi:hypothetical protein